ncbi:hypothetical protein LXM94_25140 [Rhizobium sp. TRM95111]|uniref:M10 family metallopeptidase C-terminal domain-containing protein n=1 Tax=Rhizobium alarense TaxID=2846851 RepID=UPI001F2E7223|nr:hypothetical protein [Rhizobium alarense]MCF3643248.1 hypothetical protein [Rhizobium alarense]
MTANATGNAETQVSTLVADSTFDPMITLLPAGGWIAVWTAENEEPGNAFTLTGRGNLDGAGNSLANAITGNGGKNTLSGGGGNDTLEGGAGKDTLKGSGGRDRLVGDKGGGRDFIDDFSRAQGDRINLKAIDANVMAKDNQKFEFIGTDKFEEDAGELRFQKMGGNTLVSADRNGDGKADFAILVDGNITFKAGDFIL